MSDMQRWKDKNGHVLGLIKNEGHGSKRLALLREAMDASEAEPGEVMAVVDGADVRCSICGEMRTWVPGEAALRRLLRSQNNLQKIVSDLGGNNDQAKRF